MTLTHGYSRTVLLTRNYAVKVPRIGAGWRAWLCGLLSNLAERDTWAATRAPNLCPVLLSDPLGLVVVMPRVTPASEPPERLAHLTGHDHKCNSYGYHKGELVAIDYHKDVWREASV